MRKGLINTLIVLGVVLIFGIALFLGNQALGPDVEEAFGGTDAQATELIEESNPDYEPWFAPFFEPAGEIESGLFALQAGLGGAVLGFTLGALWMGRRISRTAVVASDTDRDDATQPVRTPGGGSS